MDGDDFFANPLYRFRVDKVLEGAAKDAGAPVSVDRFVSYKLGEGIEKEESDFAAEVAAAAGT